MSEPKEKFVDEVLDKALAGYGQGEPRLGLEARVLARLEEEKDAPARRWWKRAWVPAAAALLVAGGLYLARPRTQAPPVAANPNPAPGKTVAVQPPAVQAAVRLLVRRHPQAVAKVATVAAKPAQFPTPRPLSEQDRLLLALVRQHPQEAVQQAQAAARPLDEMKIEPLDIPPINPDGDQPAPQR